MSARKKLNQSRLRWLRCVVASAGASPALGRAFDRGKITPSSISLASIDGDSVDRVIPSGAAGAAASAGRLHNATDHPPSLASSLANSPRPDLYGSAALSECAGTVPEGRILAKPNLWNSMKLLAKSSTHGTRKKPDRRKSC